jgi:major type 1 subunit fimbrin (pilin)
MQQLTVHNKMLFQNKKMKTNQKSIIHTISKYLLTTFFILCGFGIQSASAIGLPQCSGSSANFIINFGNSINVPRDAVPGTMLSKWIYQSINTTSCTITTGFEVDGHTYQRAAIGSFTTYGSAGIVGGSVSVPAPSGSTSVLVMPTNVRGIGIAMVWRKTQSSSNTSSAGGTCGTGAQSYWISNNQAGNNGFSAGGDLWNIYPPRAPNYGYCDMKGTFTFIVEAALAIVKIGGTPPAGAKVTALNQGSNVITTIATLSDVRPDNISAASIKQNLIINPFTINSSACKTPDVTVNMGSYSQSAFKGVGSNTQPIGFNININDCPQISATEPIIKNIKYQLDPTSSIVNPISSVFPLNTSSTAKGIGLQIMDANNNVLQRQTQYSLAKTGAYPFRGNYTLPLKAAYYQTDTAVTPGKADGAITFTMTYD